MPSTRGGRRGIEERTDKGALILIWPRAGRMPHVRRGERAQGEGGRIRRRSPPHARYQKWAVVGGPRQRALRVLPQKLIPRPSPTPSAHAGIDPRSPGHRALPESSSSSRAHVPSDAEPNVRQTHLVRRPGRSDSQRETSRTRPPRPAGHRINALSVPVPEREERHGL
ncbi:hypothetical protein C2E23DRAFT_402562 [Lenzites betulinus]|nr:hypothetical protein C2E23DRAFT_402562 [Lenzites betulinus]